MNTAKEQVKEILEELPENTTLEDIQYHIYISKKIEIGLKDAEKGRTLSQEEVEKRMLKWLGK